MLTDNITKPEDRQNEAMRLMREIGMPLKMIGEHFGTSASRVCQLVAKAKTVQPRPSPDFTRVAFENRGPGNGTNHARNIEMFEAMQAGTTAKVLAHKHGISVQAVRQAVGKIEREVEYKNKFGVRLSVRAQNALTNFTDVTNAAELAAFDVSTLEGKNNVGYMTIREIEIAIATLRKAQP
jgi:hypothetical protein